ncbi:MAG: 4Fe-4S dicluster domain-containing protein [Candidatus Methanoperedens sp.]
MVRYGMVIDLDRCVGCATCAVACKAENSVTSSTPEDYKNRRLMEWNRVVTVIKGKYPNVSGSIMPLICNHCENPPCVKVCPVDATYKREDGLVLQRYERCIGCKYCMVACPYQQRFFNFSKQEGKEYHNPDVPPRISGIVEKCTFCRHRIDKAIAEGKKIGSPDGVEPACTQACPAKTRIFGDLDDPDSAVSKLLRSRRNYQLRADLGTQPQVYYLD